ncbi:hypothetical protein [Cupriavidus taiwanensis]|uniref:hypothetical protein n=1 Tax=Cupriavidus taiwanensis TaxID=164546 RepID=UPI000E105FA1
MDTASLYQHLFSSTHRLYALDGEGPLDRDLFVFYENVSFRRASCLVNLPNHLERANPSLNGLVDRYHAYAYAQVLLFDQPQFPDASGTLQFKPEEYQWKK